MSFDYDQSRGERSDSDREEPVGGQSNRRSYSVPGSTAAGTTTLAEAETHYDREIEDTDEWRYLERMEQRHGARFHQWIREGVPTDAMQSDADIEAYRERKGTPVPWDIETFNRRSVWRNVGEASRRLRRGPAGRTSVPEVVREVISSRGRSLDSSVRETVEERMGESFDDVQIHTDARAADAAEAIDARAFTVGNHIVFNHGEYDPESPEGQRVLVHELVHVRQQTGGALSMLPKEDVALEVDPDPGLEREAEETARRVVLGGDVGIQRLSDTAIHVQRASDEESLSDELTDVLRGVQQQSDLADGAIQTVREVIESGGQFLHEAGIHFVAAGGADAVRAVIRLENSATETRDLLKGTNHLTDEQIRTIATVVADADSGPALAQKLPPDALARTNPAAVVDLDNNLGVETEDLANIIPTDSVTAARVRELLRMEFTDWSPGDFNSGSANLRDHADRHRGDWNPSLSRSEYISRAMSYANGEVSGTELYYQPGRDNLVVYDPSDNTVVIAGSEDSKIHTMYRVDPGSKGEIDGLKEQIEDHWTYIKEP